MVDYIITSLKFVYHQKHTMLLHWLHAGRCHAHHSSVHAAHAVVRRWSSAGEGAGRRPASSVHERRSAAVHALQISLDIIFIVYWRVRFMIQQLDEERYCSPN